MFVNFNNKINHRMLGDTQCRPRRWIWFVGWGDALPEHEEGKWWCIARQINGFLFLFSWAPARPSIYLCQNPQFIRNKASDSNNLTVHKDSKIQASRLFLGHYFLMGCQVCTSLREGECHCPSGAPIDQVRCSVCFHLWFDFLPPSLR